MSTTAVILLYSLGNAAVFLTLWFRPLDRLERWMKRRAAGRLTAAEKADPLSVIFTEARCPDCGCDKLITWHDMGHDVSVTCENCRSAFGLQTSPFFIAERIKDRLGEQGV